MPTLAGYLKVTDGTKTSVVAIYAEADETGHSARLYLDTEELGHFELIDPASGTQLQIPTSSGVKTVDLATEVTDTNIWRLYMDGVDDIIRTSNAVLNITAIEMEFTLLQREDWHQFVNLNNNIINYVSNTDNLTFSNDFAHVYVNGVEVVRNTPFLTVGERVILRAELADGVNSGSAGAMLFSNSVTQYVKADVYDIKLFQGNGGATLAAHYDLRKGDVLPGKLADQTGNGRHFDRTTGTWLRDDEQPEAPDNVSNLQADDVTESSVTLSWSASPNATSYDIYSGATLLGNVTGTAYTATGLDEDTAYTFTVKAKNGFGSASGSSVTTTTLPSQEDQPPAAVAGLQVNEVHQDSITLSWTASPGADYYVVEYGTSSESTSATAITIENLQPETSYTITVTAVNEFGSSTGASITVTTGQDDQTPGQGAIFSLNFGGRGGTTSNTVNDIVGSVPCTLVNVSHDGVNDGFITDKGLTLQSNDYVSIPSDSGDLYDALQAIHTTGLTFEIQLYNAKGILFRNDPFNFSAYLTDYMYTRYRWADGSGTEALNSPSFTWLVNPEGNRLLKDTLNGDREINVITVRFRPGGVVDMLVNGRPTDIAGNVPSGFDHYADIFAASPLFIRRDATATNAGSSTIRSFTIYNAVMTDQEVLDRYNGIKENEPLYEVHVVPDEVNLEPGQSQLVAVTASPSRYTELLQNDYESFNPGYATVDNGLITGQLEGETEITVTSTYGGQTWTNTVEVQVGSNVIEPPQSTRTVDGISLNRTVDRLEVGQSFAAIATTLPFDVFNDNLVVWSTSNPAVCRVDYGVLTGASVGTATITATDSSGMYSASFDVDVVATTATAYDPEDVYEVSLSLHGIRNDGTEAADTTDGIQDALDYARDNGYSKVVFPLGSYLITPEARTLLPHSNTVIDFSGSEVNIAPNALSPNGYVMWKFINVENAKIVHMRLYGEADSVANVVDASEGCISVWFDKAENCGLEDCTVSKSPGFNIVGHNQSLGDGIGRHPSKDNWEAGQIDPATGLEDDSVTTYRWRSKDFLNANGMVDTYVLGYMQGYFGYDYLRSRLYSIFWYDANQDFIEAHEYNLQFCTYSLPAGACYAKIVIYQDNAPTNQDNDFSAVAMLRTVTMPVNCFVRNCIIEDNNSCGLAMTGGCNWLIEGNTFARNGQRMPAANIDWEDGWELSVGDICRNNVFDGPNGVNVSGGQSLALYGNTFNQSNLHVWNRAANFRIFNNFFNGKGRNSDLTIETGADAYFVNNILKSVNYHTAIAHPGADYRVRDTGNTLI